MASHWPKWKHADKNTHISRDPFTHFTFCSWQCWTYHASLPQRCWLNVNAKITLSLPPIFQLSCCFLHLPNIMTNYCYPYCCACVCHVMVVISLFGKLSGWSEGDGYSTISQVQRLLCFSYKCISHHDSVPVKNFFFSELPHTFIQTVALIGTVFISGYTDILKWIFDFSDIDYIWVTQKSQRSPCVFITCLLYQMCQFYCLSIISYIV